MNDTVLIGTAKSRARHRARSRHRVTERVLQEEGSFSL